MLTVHFAFFLLRERDTDKDGKVNFNEFFHGLFDLVRNYNEEGHNSSHESSDLMEAPAKKLFSQLDKDGDGYYSNIFILNQFEELHFFFPEDFKSHSILVVT